MTEEGGVTTAVSPHQGEVESLVRDGRWDAAAVVLRERVREVPDDASALNDLGVVCHAKGAYEEAEAALDHAHAVEPENLEILHNLAQASFSLGMFERTLRLIDAARGLGGGAELEELAVRSRAALDRMTLYPRFVSIETASVCNARCHFCETPNVRRTPFMEEAVWRKIVDDNRTAGVEFRLNMDGEPTLHAQLPDIIAYIKTTTNCKVTFNTNAERLTPDLGRAILEAGVDGVRFSIDGFRKETFEKHRIGLNYNVVVANVLSFLNAREKSKHAAFVEIRMIRFPNNEGERDAFGLFWSSFPRVKVILTTPYYWPDIGHDGVARPCFRGEDDFELYYYTDGRATLCCMDWQEKAVLGDGRKYSTREIWNSPLARSWRKNLREGRRDLIPLCSGCNQDLDQDAEFELGSK
ncbi:MAG TPA: radical SAM protein [Planctomycetes bacterium]|nr:radical SAM protein [Planctomycetota bacterium]